MAFAFHDQRFLIAAGVLVVVLAIVFALDFTRRRHLYEKLGHAPQLARMALSVSPGRRRLKAALLVCGVALTALALARPQTEGQKLWKQRGIDVVLAIDFSKSMLAQDVYPSRIDVARLASDKLLDKFGGDRVALVAFGGEAVHYPLTTDHEAARLLYNGLDPKNLAPGTDIGEAIRTGRCLLRYDVPDSDCAYLRGAHGGGGATAAAPARPAPPPVPAADGEHGRAIVVFTDGEDTEGHAKAEVEKARKAGVEVYFVGVGTKAGARIPEYDDEGRFKGWTVVPGSTAYYSTHLDEDALKELAIAAGGEDHVFYADPRGFKVDAVVKALARLKEGNLDERVESIPSEAYQFVLFPGFMLLLIEACLSDRRRGRVRA
jgi:Ca-activated chloride channel family protein